MTIRRPFALLLLAAAAGCGPQSVPGGPVAGDTRPPEITRLLVTPPLAGRETAVEISFHVDELIAQAEVVVAGNQGQCEKAVQGLVVCGYRTRGDEPEGSQLLWVRAVDLAGNRAEATGSLVLDFLAPTLTLVRAPGPVVNQREARFEFTVDEPSRVSCSLDAAAAVPCQSPVTFSDLAEGAHRVALAARDEVGNEATKVVDFAVDTVIPETTLDAAPPALSNLAVARFEFSSPDATASFACSLDRAQWTECASPLELALAEGGHELSVRAVDAAGNADTSPATAAFLLDRTAPRTVIDPIPDTGLPAREIAFHADDPEASFECAFERGPFEPCSSPRLLSGLADGTFRFAVRASDPAGNLESPGPAANLVVDTTAPRPRFDSGPSDGSTAADGQLVFGADEPASFECSLDGAPLAPCSSPATAALSADGAHRFELVATDGYGNRSEPASWSWSSDAFAPTVTISSAPPALSRLRSATLAYAANKPGCTLRCALDAAAPVDCFGSSSFVNLAEGDHRFSVTATDAQGRPGSPAVATWKVDSLAPSAAIERAPNSLSNESPARFEFSADEPDCGFECQLDGAAFAACSSPAQLPVGEGAHVFSVRASDPAGNPGSPVTAFFTTDLTPPAAPGIDQPDPSLVSNTTPTFTWGAAATAIRYELELSTTEDFSQLVERAETASRWFVPSPLASARYFFRVRGRDAAGNDSAWSPSGMLEVRSWHFLNPQPQGATLWAAGCSDAARCIFVGEAGTALRTEDGGATLVQSATGARGTLAGLHRFNAARAVAVGADGVILRTTDGGITWWPVASGTRSDLHAVRFRAEVGWAAGENGMMLKSTDGGASWTRQTTNSTAAVRDLAILDAGAQTVVAVGGTGAVLRSENGGLDWASHPSGVSKLLHSVSFVDASLGFAAGESGVMRKTTDGGRSWGSVTTSNTQELYGVVFTGSLTGYSLGDSTTALASIRQTADGGLTWTNLNELPGPSMRRLHFVAGTATAWAVGEGGAIRKSTDGGASFAPIAAASGGTTQTINQDLRAVQFVSPSVGYVFGGSGFAMKTVDGGESLQPLTSPVFTATRDLYSACFLDATHGWVGGSASFLVRTSDGESFAQVPMPTGFSMSIRALHFASDQSGLVVGTNGDVLRWDGAALEQLSSPTTRSLRAVKLADAANGFAAGDGGTLLRYSALGLVAESSGVSEDLFGVWAFDATRAIAVGDKGRILRRGAGGWSVVASGTGLVLKDVGFANATDGWIVGDGIVLVTHDGGLTWNQQLSPTGSTLQAVSAPTSEAVFAAGGGRNLIRSSVGGR